MMLGNTQGKEEDRAGRDAVAPSAALVVVTSRALRLYGSRQTEEAKPPLQRRDRLAD